jgi:hypothetical protein
MYKTLLLLLVSQVALAQLPNVGITPEQNRGTINNTPNQTSQPAVIATEQLPPPTIDIEPCKIPAEITDYVLLGMPLSINVQKTKEVVKEKLSKNYLLAGHVTVKNAKSFFGPVIQDTFRLVGEGVLPNYRVNAGKSWVTTNSYAFNGIEMFEQMQYHMVFPTRKDLETAKIRIDAALSKHTEQQLDAEKQAVFSLPKTKPFVYTFSLTVSAANAEQHSIIVEVRPYGDNKG